MLPVLVRLVADAGLIAGLLFASAGTLNWGRAWVLVSVMLVVRVGTAVVVYRVNPALLRDRARVPIHRDQPSTDKVLLLVVIATGFVALPVIVALDVFRWHVLPPPSPWLSGVGLLVFTVGWVIKGLALRANAFATTVLRLQHERRHALADTGVYGIVRHPFYAATPLVLVGMCVWLGSYLAGLLVVVPTTFVVMRLVLEERFLRRELPGYEDYVARVPHRLLPRIW